MSTLTEWGNVLNVSRHSESEGAGEAVRRAIAVALAYDPAEADAPRVVASGRGAQAERILQLAFASGVKVREDADLAEILAAVDVDSIIPVEAFTAVAEILSYIYRQQGVAWGEAR